MHHTNTVEDQNSMTEEHIVILPTVAAIYDFVSWNPLHVSDSHTRIVHILWLTKESGWLYFWNWWLLWMTLNKCRPWKAPSSHSDVSEVLRPVAGAPVIRDLSKQRGDDGKHKVLICEAEGSPKPTVSWSINGTSVCSALIIIKWKHWKELNFHNFWRAYMPVYLWLTISYSVWKQKDFILGMFSSFCASKQKNSSHSFRLEET